MTDHYGHEYYVIPGIVDAAVVKAKAEYARDHEGMRSLVHHHRYGEPCDVARHDEYVPKV
jgi:hypothetical protein